MATLPIPQPELVTQEDSRWTWSSLPVILLMVNAVLGLISFEWAWYKLYRFRRPIPELESLMPAFRRNDVKYWRKWLYYPGAVTIMWPRFLFGVIDASILVLLVKIVLIGQPMREPIVGFRRSLVRYIFKFWAFLFQLFTNFTIATWKTLSMDDVNHYQEWLGPIEEQEKEQFGGILGHHRDENHNSTDYSDNNLSPVHQNSQPRIPKRGKGPPSTIVCNHIGWLEIMALITSPLHPGFTPKAELENAPLLGTACRGLQSLFIQRGAGIDTREKVIEQIKERQSQVEDLSMSFNPMCLFAEGTTTNGSSLLRFKRGAFSGMRTVIPCYVKVNDRMFSPTYEVIPFWPMVILMLSSFCVYHIELTIMPEFQPTIWMLNNHSSKSDTEEDWDIYAECVREAMARHSGLRMDDRTNKEKLDYENFMHGIEDEVTIDGKTYHYPRSLDDNYQAVPREENLHLVKAANGSIQ